MGRTELLERYRALPMPTTTDESWRFTDLAGFDPDAFAQNGQVPVSDTGTMLDIDVAGLATVGAGIEIERAPEGIRFELLDESHPQLGQLVCLARRCGDGRAAPGVEGGAHRRIDADAVGPTLREAQRAAPVLGLEVALELGPDLFEARSHQPVDRRRPRPGTGGRNSILRAPEQRGGEYRDPEQRCVDQDPLDNPESRRGLPRRSRPLP